MSKTKKNSSRHKSKHKSRHKLKNSSDILTSRLNTSKKYNSHDNNDTNDTNNNDTNDNDNYNNVKNDSMSSKSFSIKFSTKKFFSRTQSIVKRGPKPKINKKDLFALFITDNKNNLINGKTIYNNKLDKYIFNKSDTKCICENIFSNPKTKLPDDCECHNIRLYSSQGKSGAKIHSIKCMKNQEILKTVALSNYYINMRTQTNKYMFIEMDGFAIQTIINTYVYREIPNNTVNIINSGVCKKSSIKEGYNLMEEADLGSGRQFLNKLLSSFYDDEFNINNEDKRYVAIVNFLLQITLIIGHLQSSPLEFFHGDYKPENVFVKRLDKKTLSHFTFNVFGKLIKVKNLGYAVLIADFDRSSITIKDVFNPKKYRIISPILFKPLLTSNVNNIIKKYGDIDPDRSFLEKSRTKNNNQGNPERKIKKTKTHNIDKNILKNGVKFDKLFLSNLIPRKMDPTITILRSAGVKLFRDFDMYTFFIRLVETENVRKYIREKRIDANIMSFMSKKFLEELYSKPAKEISLNESAFIAVEILDKIKEPMYSVFSSNYISRLESLNYKLFR
jgi:hypothetical protein